MELFSDEYFMQQALTEARRAFEGGEVPVGALVVCNNKIIARAYNQTELLCDVTAHAEMLALTSAANSMGSKYLPDCTLYVTLEPCVMCAGALAWGQIGRIVYGAADEKRGFSVLAPNCLHPKTIVQQGILASGCKGLLQSFFTTIR